MGAWFPFLLFIDFLLVFSSVFRYNGIPYRVFFIYCNRLTAICLDRLKKYRAVHARYFCASIMNRLSRLFLYFINYFSYSAACAFRMKVFRSKSIIPSSFKAESSLVIAERFVQRNCAISVRLRPSSIYFDFCFCACSDK